MKFFDEEKIHIYLSYVIVFLLILFFLLFFFILGKTKKEESVVPASSSIEVKEDREKEVQNKEEDKEIVLTSFKVDIKGAVKSPGVYEAHQGMVVQDIITLAGGLKSNASTKFINLAYKVSEQMVIRILTTAELKELGSELKESCVCESVDTSSCDKESLLIISEKKEESTSPNENKSEEKNKEEHTDKEDKTSLVSINKATLQELMTLSGIGEAKAKAILTYREQNGAFKTLEDLKKVSGIGDAVYQKIKDFIQL